RLPARIHFLIDCPYLDADTEAEARMLGNHGYGMAQVLGPNHQQPAQVLFGLGERAVHHHDLVPFRADCLRGRTALERHPADPVTRLAARDVKRHALLDHRVLLGSGNRVPALFSDISETGERRAFLPGTWRGEWLTTVLRVKCRLAFE